MSKRGNGHQVPARVRQHEDNRGEDVKAAQSKQALARQNARFAARAGRDGIMGHAPPEQHVQELRGSEAQAKFVKAAEPTPAPVKRAEEPRYLLQDAKAMVGAAFHLALAPFRLARSVLRGLLSRNDATTA